MRGPAISCTPCGISVPCCGIGVYMPRTAVIVAHLVCTLALATTLLAQTSGTTVAPLGVPSTIYPPEIQLGSATQPAIVTVPPIEEAGSNSRALRQQRPTVQHRAIVHASFRLYCLAPGHNPRQHGRHLDQPRRIRPRAPRREARIAAPQRCAQRHRQPHGLPHKLEVVRR